MNFLNDVIYIVLPTYNLALFSFFIIIILNSAFIVVILKNHTRLQHIHSGAANNFQSVVLDSFVQIRWKIGEQQF
jgi:hypothetical protein